MQPDEEGHNSVESINATAIFSPDVTILSLYKLTTCIEL